MRKTKIELGKPYVFKACGWDEPSWEFGSPRVVYSPVKRYASGAGSTRDLLEDTLDDICFDEELTTGWNRDDLQEFKWRGWNKDGFSRRKSANHIVMRVEFVKDENGEVSWIEV